MRMLLAGPPHGPAVTASQLRTPGLYSAANYIPLWADMAPDSRFAVRVLHSLQASGVVWFPCMQPSNCCCSVRQCKF